MVVFIRRFYHCNACTHSSRTAYKTIVGVEVHAQIKSMTKIFSPSLSYDSTSCILPNRNIHPFDIALPGTLPSLNHECVRQAIRLGLFLNGHVNRYTSFQRKHYFYPDLPAGYQITQLDEPIVTGGHIDLQQNDRPRRRIRITRIQLEHDSGRLQHNDDMDTKRQWSCVDLNRAGMGLLEIVSEPDLIGSDETILFIRQLQSLLQYTNISDASMDTGALRIDVNISLSSKHVNTPRVEIKNMRSFRDIINAIKYETRRQTTCLSDGVDIDRETRGYNAKTKTTYVMRSKEELLDYRMYREVDLPTLYISEEFINQVSRTLPETFEELRQRMQTQYDLNTDTINMFVTNIDMMKYFEEMMKYNDNKQAQTCANWLTTELTSYLHKSSISYENSIVSPSQLVEIVQFVEDMTISGKVGKQLVRMIQEGDKRQISTIIDEDELKQINDQAYIQALCREIIEKHPNEVEKYINGTKRKRNSMVNYLAGQVIRKSKKKVNPTIVNNACEQELKNI